MESGQDANVVEDLRDSVLKRVRRILDRNTLKSTETGAKESFGGIDSEPGGSHTTVSKISGDEDQAKDLATAGVSDISSALSQLAKQRDPSLPMPPAFYLALTPKKRAYGQVRKVSGEELWETPDAKRFPKQYLAYRHLRAQRDGEKQRQQEELAGYLRRNPYLKTLVMQQIFAGESPHKPALTEAAGDLPSPPAASETVDPDTVDRTDSPRSPGGHTSALCSTDYVEGWVLVEGRYVDPSVFNGPLSLYEQARIWSLGVGRKNGEMAVPEAVPDERELYSTLERVKRQKIDSEGEPFSITEDATLNAKALLAEYVHSFKKAKGLWMADFTSRMKKQIPDLRFVLPEMFQRQVKESK